MTNSKTWYQQHGVPQDKDEAYNQHTPQKH